MRVEVGGEVCGRCCSSCGGVVGWVVATIVGADRVCVNYGGFRSMGMDHRDRR